MTSESTPDPINTVAAMPWYRSPVQIANITALVSAVVALFPKVGQWLHLSSPSDVSNAITTVFAFIAVLAPAVGTVFRANSKVQPLTLTKASAEASPNTVANNAATAAVAAGVAIPPTAVSTKDVPK